MREFCQNIGHYPQYHPPRNPGGDCFCCALIAAMRHLFPGEYLPFDAYLSMFHAKTLGGSDVVSGDWNGLRLALGRCSTKFGHLDIMTDIVQPQFDLDHWSHGWFTGAVQNTYYRRLEGYLRSGWAVFTEIDYHGNGPATQDKRRNSIDHSILLDGVREFWKPSTRSDGASTLTYEIHVVCSARGPYWIELGGLLHLHGAAGWMMCRRSI